MIYGVASYWDIWFPLTVQAMVWVVIVDVVCACALCLMSAQSTVSNKTVVECV